MLTTRAQGSFIHLRTMTLHRCRISHIVSKHFEDVEYRVAQLLKFLKLDFEVLTVRDRVPPVDKFTVDEIRLQRVLISSSYAQAV